MTEILLSLLLSLMALTVVWPEMRPKGPIEAYLLALSPTFWKEEAKIYDKMLEFYPMLEPKQHNQILVYLYRKGYVERHIEWPGVIREIESPNRFERTYIDHIEPFSTVTVKYRLAQKDGGKRRKKQKIIPWIRLIEI